MTSLVIVESPTKAKTISRFLGSDFIVKSSFGHVRDLPKGELGIDTEKDFEPRYIIPTKAKKNVSALKKDAAKADAIVLATDEDREGEAIAWHLVQALGVDKLKEKNKDLKIERIVFHEITQNAIKEALAHPRKIYNNLVDAQQARRILDRLVGYKLSPFLWKKVARGLSAGRVQSVAVRLIVEREREIEKFNAEEYWTVTALLKPAGAPDTVIESHLIRISDKAVEKLDIKTQAQADGIVKDLSGAAWKVQNVEKNEATRSPFAPFTTSTMQQDAAKKLKFSSKQTMVLAQQLYEGVQIDGEAVGLITYMRTDSLNVAQEALDKAGQYIRKAFGNTYHEARKFKTKSKSAQEAHEAIRPTDPARTPENVQKHLTPQQFRLYALIWRRFIGSQMPKAVFDATTIDVSAKNYVFRATGSTLKFDGFLKVYPTKFEENELPVVKTGEELDLLDLKPEQHFTKPPARYNEASLIKILEKEGIGRPSTYAPIISTIQARNYVTKDRSRYFHPTEIGTLVNDLLVEHFPEIVDIKFTSKMESELDRVAEGATEWKPVIRDFYEPFAKHLEEKYQEVTKEQVTQQEKTGEKCPLDGGDLIFKMGRFGRFVACGNFPNCKYIKKKEKAPAEKVGRLCPEDGGELVHRASRFGKFIACSNYPKCKYTEKIAKEGGEKKEKTEK